MKKKVTCPRCNGTDFVARFAHRDQGHCWLCRGKGTVLVAVLPDGTVDHDHRIAWPNSEDRCVLCGLPIAQWPPVVFAKWWESSQCWEVHLPGSPAIVGTQIRGESRRKAQNEARRLILERVPNARIKWTAT